MPKRPDSLETLQIALELVRRIPKGRTITAVSYTHLDVYKRQVLCGSKNFIAAIQFWSVPMVSTTSWVPKNWKN